MFTYAKMIATLAFLAMSGMAHAQVYRCKTADGNTVYQQIPCSAKDNETGEKVKIWAQPSEADIAAAQRRLYQQELAREQAEYERALLNSAHAESQTYQNAPSARQPANTIPTGNSPCPPGQVPLNASGFDPNRGWSSSKGYVPLRCGSTDRQASSRATRTGPGYTEPRQIFDQYGNLYLQPPGSGFATDTKTGKQCVVSGNVIVSCN